ncbi:MAG TPA: PilZ domain-containing protein [Terriglobales bacterium]
MGEDREARKDIKLAVRIFGTDAAGRVFSENVHTCNISYSGAELTGVGAQLKIDDVIGLACGSNKGRFRIRWVGRPNTSDAGRIGLLNLAPDKPLWDVPTPQGIEKGTWPDARDRRVEPRVKCKCSIEVYADNQAAPIRSRTGDLSVGGCFIEMSIPLPLHSNAKIGVWLNETKVWARAKVVSCTPGFGIGVRFLEVSQPDKQKLRDFLQSMTRIRI